jgi:hypothetical protein
VARSRRRASSRADGPRRGKAGAGGPASTTSDTPIVPGPHVTAATGPALPSARFAAAADAICGTYRRHSSATSQATTLAAQEHIYAGVVDAATEAIASLRALSPPAAERPTFTRYLQLTATAIDDFVAAQGRSRSTREATGVEVENQDFLTFQHLAHDATAADAVARKLGFDVCGSAGSDWL